jgi:hypothetical protein
MLLFGAGKGLSGSSSTGAKIKISNVVSTIQTAQRTLRTGEQMRAFNRRQFKSQYIGNRRQSCLCDWRKPQWYYLMPVYLRIGKLGINSTESDHNTWVQVQHEAFKSSAPALIDVSTGFGKYFTSSNEKILVLF